MIIRHRIDCVIETAYFGPFNLPKHVARITFIHDMTPVLFPHLHPWVSQALPRVFFPRIMRQATRLITNSQHTTQDVGRLFPGTKDKVITNYLGVDPFFIRRRQKHIKSFRDPEPAEKAIRKILWRVMPVVV